MRIRKLLWDKKVINKIDSKHNVSIYEVKEVCFGEKLILRGRKGIYYVLGQSKAGRYLFVVLSDRGESHEAA